MLSVKLGTHLNIERCPHCNINKPNLIAINKKIETNAFDGSCRRFWISYRCASCGGVVLASSDEDGGLVKEQYPTRGEIDGSIPKPASDYLRQALDSLHAPAGSVMLCASAVDAMLKAKKYTDGNLYTRIEKAKNDHLITDEMALWAHEVRLDANEPRHADEEVPIPNREDARKCVDFVIALAQFLFVLPARVERGRAEAKRDLPPEIVTD